MEKILSIISKQRLERLIFFLLCGITITPAIVAGSFLFPYIAPRTVYFRIILELALLFFLLILIIYKFKIKIKQQYFLYIFGGFVIANIISSLFSFSPIVAWFSDTERMWGVFTLLHLFLLYFILRIFFSGKEWKIFLNILILVGLYVSIYGICQYYPEVFGIEVFQAGKGRIISTLGNSAYVAIYMIFNAFFALFLLLKSKKKWLKYYFGVVIIINLVAFNLAGIRGTTIGLLAGITISLLVYILLGKNKKYKIIIASILIIGPLTLFYAQLNPNIRFIKNNELFNKVVNISLSDSTVETRFIGWNAAWEGFKERPIFGAGIDNYHVVFNKYFDSDYYLYAPSEPYFDRSHNAWLDVLVMNGLVGFVIFLSFPFFIFYYLIKGYRQKKIKFDEFLIFTALSITYFIHLIFVFDDLNSYFYFVILVAFIEYRYYKEPILEIKEARPFKSVATKYLAGGVVIIAVITVVYSLNIKTLQAGNAVIQAMRNRPNLPEAARLFNKAIEYNSSPSRNIVSSYVNYLISLGPNLPAIKQDPQTHEAMKQAVLNAFEALDQEIKKDPYNAMLYSRRASLNNIAFIVFQNEIYFFSAIAASEKAIELSPEHLQYYYTLAETYIITGNSQKAINTIQEAININNRYNANYFQLARVYLSSNRLDEALNATKLFVKQKYSPETSTFFIGLSNKFLEQGNNNNAAEVLKLALSQRKDKDVLINLSRLYIKSGNSEEAIKTLSELIPFGGDIGSEANYAIGQIRAGKINGLQKQMDSGQK